MLLWRPLLGLLGGALLVFALLRVVMPRTSRESAVDHRLRQAQWLSVAFGGAALPLVVLCVVALNPGGTPNRAGMVVYLVLVTLVAVAVPVLRAVWRRVRVARDAADDEARRIAGLPIPDPDAPAPRHRGLSGEEPPPRRW